MDRDLRLPALVLLDEIGAGTDPIEGGALGVAIVDQFRTRGALVLGTTHYDALKTYAQTTPGVQCAAFAFDPVGFAPTYELIYGSPGRSLALEMAGRLGLSRKVIEKARASLGTRELQLANQLARVDDDLAQLGEERKAAAHEREAMARARAAAERREEELRAREEAFKRKVTDRVEERVRAATREIDDVVAALKRQTSALTAREVGVPRLSTGDHGALKAHAKAAVEAAAAQALGNRASEAGPSGGSGRRNAPPTRRGPRNPAALRAARHRQEPHRRAGGDRCAGQAAARARQGPDRADRALGQGPGAGGERAREHRPGAA